MGGCRCSYKSCTNTTKSRESLHFFHYPVKQKERCRQWIENAHKTHFYNLDEDQLRNKVVCELHFENCYFPNMQKKRLLQAAVPTLDGDALELHEETVFATTNEHDVQVLPCSADGTIFVVETKMPNPSSSQRIESYIYTNNGLVLPINNNKDSVVNGSEIGDDNVQIYASNNDMDIEDSNNSNLDDLHDVDTKLFPSALTTTNCDDGDNFDTQSSPTTTEVEAVRRYMFRQSTRESHNILDGVDSYKTKNNSSTKPLIKQRINNNDRNEQSSINNNNNSSNDLFIKIMGNKYLKKINQHSKDIALIKRLLKNKRTYRRPQIINNLTVLNTLKTRVAKTLLTVLSLNMNNEEATSANTVAELSPDDCEFFSNIYTTSPEVYRLLSEKYQWNLPNPTTLPLNKCNGNNGTAASSGSDEDK